MSLPCQHEVQLFFCFSTDENPESEQTYEPQCVEALVCWATGRHCIICHPEVLLQLSSLPANFCWDSICKTIRGVKYGTSGERRSQGWERRTLQEGKWRYGCCCAAMSEGQVIKNLLACCCSSPRALFLAGAAKEKLNEEGKLEWNILVTSTSGTVLCFLISQI